MTRIAVIQGHPSKRPDHFCRALAQAYVRGACAAGHEVREIVVTDLDFPVLRERESWEHGEPVSDIAAAQATIAWAEHLVIVFPLWLGTLPALLKAFFEQVFRPGFGTGRQGEGFGGALKGRSARLVVTMGMPGLVYRLWFGARGVRTFEQGVLRLLGIKPTRRTLIGSVESLGDAGRADRLAKIEKLGRAAG